MLQWATFDSPPATAPIEQTAMIFHASTFLTSMALDALLCACVCAGLAKSLPSSSEALTRWAASMLCFSVSFLLARWAPADAAFNLAQACLGAVGSTLAFGACRSLHGLRRLRRAPWLAGACVAALWLSLAWPGLAWARTTAALWGAGTLFGLGAMSFARERRWRSNFCGWVAIIALMGLACCCAALGAVIAAREPTPANVLAPAFFALQAFFLASSLGFLLAASEIERGHARDACLRDGLTGLMNKKGFQEVCAPILAKARRDGTPMAAMMFDIDHFKQVNDQRGHLAGDAAIAHAGQAIVQALRSSDVCARFGGDEFCALLPEATAQAAFAIAQRILDAARDKAAPFSDHQGARIHFTFSIGLHAWAAGSAPESLSEILAKADEALYASKRAGRDRITMTR
jgi:diguanylate cyclase (GGDEF)-like protein